MKKGYIALSSIIVISAVLIIIVVSVSLLSVSETQVSLGEQKKETTIDYLEACVEDALLQLNNQNAIPTQIPLPEGNCDVTIDSQVGSSWTFTVSGTQDNYTKAVQVQADRGTEVAITSWKEIQ